MRLLFFILLCVSLIFSGYKSKPITSEYEIKNFYEAVSPDNSDTKVFTKSGDLEDVEYVLIPAKMEEGKYKVTLSKKGSNIYRIDGTKYWVETRYCYEYASYEEVILIVESSYGYTKGKVIF